MKSLSPILALLVALLAAPVQAQWSPPLQQAPAFSLKTPTGETMNFPQDAQGNPTVLMFWPSWCPFSRALQPYVDDIWKDYRATGVKVWTLNIKEDKDPVQVMKDRGLSFPLLLNADEVANRFRLAYTPWLVVVDGGGRNIVYTRPPKPPTPVDTAREVREKLNELLGAKAVPMPASFPKPYDLHLKDPKDLNKKLKAVEVPPGEWGPWVTRYLAAIPEGEKVAGLAPRGPLAKGRDAIAAAKAVWTERYGEEKTLEQAPYRAYRQNNRWVVLGDGLNPRLGEGYVLVIEADSGTVVRVAEKAAQ